MVPSPFVHGDAGLLRVPDLKADPRDAAAHTAAIIRELPNIVEDARGALVLFSSRKQMQDVFDGLDRDWRKLVLIQGNLSKQETLNKHKARVDDGQHSVLFGLASFAEGVDLPGAYCEHVVIAKIPLPCLMIRSKRRWPSGLRLAVATRSWKLPCPMPRCG